MTSLSCGLTLNLVDEMETIFPISLTDRPTEYAFAHCDQTHGFPASVLAGFNLIIPGWKAKDSNRSIVGIRGSVHPENLSPMRPLDSARTFR